MLLNGNSTDPELGALPFVEAEAVDLGIDGVPFFVGMDLTRKAKADRKSQWVVTEATTGSTVGAAAKTKALAIAAAKERVKKSPAAAQLIRDHVAKAKADGKGQAQLEQAWMAAHQVMAYDDLLSESNPNQELQAQQNAARAVNQAESEAVNQETNPVITSDKSDRRAYRDEVASIAKVKWQTQNAEFETADGYKVKVSWGGIRHALNRGLPSWQESLAALHVQEMVERATHESTAPDKNGRSDPHSTSIFTTNVVLEGENYDAKVYVRNHTDGSRYYDHVVLDEKNSPTGLTESDQVTEVTDTPTHPYVGHESSIAPTPRSDKAAQPIGELDGDLVYRNGLGKAYRELEHRGKLTRDYLSDAELAEMTPVVANQADTIDTSPERVENSGENKQLEPASHDDDVGRDRGVLAEIKPNENNQPEKIDDYGQKIGGAAKDNRSKFTKAISDALPDTVSAVSLAKHFPEPDYPALLDAGVSLRELAAVKALRNLVPAKPKMSGKLRAWLGKFTALRSMASDLMAGEMTTDELLGVLSSSTAIHDALELKNKIRLYAELGYPAFMHAGKAKIVSAQFSVFEGQRGKIDKEVLTLPDGRTAYFDTRAEALAALNTRIQATIAQSEASGKTGKETKLDVYKLRGSQGYIVGKKIATGKFIDLKGGFATAKEAFQHIEDFYGALIEKLEALKKTPNERRAINNDRVGVDRRTSNVSAAQFAEAFGFDGRVEFGNSMPQDERQRNLNKAYDALADLADVLNIPSEAISLNGSLGLGFGSRGKGGIGAAAAHFESNNLAINLTRNHGAGSLGHEWLHALDNYFSRVAGYGGDFISNNPYPKAIHDKTTGQRSYSDAMRHELLAAWEHVVKTIQKSGMTKRSETLDRTRSKDYWSTDIELMARAFERYLIDKAESKGITNDYLANITEQAAWDRVAPLENSYPYPSQEEAAQINEAFDTLFSTMKVKEVGGRKVLHSKAPKARAAEWLSILSKVSKGEAGEGMFQNPMAPKSQQTLREVAETVSEGRIKVSEPLQDDSTGDLNYFLKMPDGSTATMVETRKGEVFVDASQLHSTTSRGSLLYNIVGNYAFNTGKVFIGDPAGLSVKALFRRTEQMASLALKFGTTSFMKPHPKQEGKGFGMMDEAAGEALATPLHWSDNDAENFQSLLETSYANAIALAPEIKNVRYDFEHRQFVDGSGNPVTNEQFDAMSRRAAVQLSGRGMGYLVNEAARVGNEGDARGLVGSASLKTAALYQSLVSESSSQVSGRSVLDQISRQLRRDGLDSALSGIRYSDSADSADSAGPATQHTVESIRAELLKANPATARLIRNGKLQIVQSVAELPADIRQSVDGETQAFYDPQTQQAYIVADGLQDDAYPVLLHELGHASKEEGGIFGTYAKVLSKILDQASTTQALREAVDERLADAGLDESHPDYAEERLMYAVEEAAQRDDIGSRSFTRRAIDALRAFYVKAALKFGLPVKLVEQDLYRLAEAELKRMANARNPSDNNPSGRKTVQHSTAQHSTPQRNPNILHSKAAKAKSAASDTDIWPDKAPNMTTHRVTQSYQSSTRIMASLRR